MKLFKAFKALVLTTALAVSSSALVFVQQNRALSSSTNFCYDGQGSRKTSDVLQGNDALSPSDFIQSASGRYTLIYQCDGNLVLYDGYMSGNSVYGYPVWASNTAGKAGYDCVMQTDGNLVIYGYSKVIAASDTNGNYGAYLRVQDDGNVVIYTNPKIPQHYALWSSNQNSLSIK